MLLHWFSFQFILPSLTCSNWPHMSIFAVALFRLKLLWIYNATFRCIDIKMLIWNSLLLRFWIRNCVSTRVVKMSEKHYQLSICYRLYSYKWMITPHLNHFPKTFTRHFIHFHYILIIRLVNNSYTHIFNVGVVFLPYQQVSNHIHYILSGELFNLLICSTPIYILPHSKRSIYTA